MAFYDAHRQVFETPTLWFMPGGTWPDGEQERPMNEWHGEHALVTDRLATHAVSALGSDGKNFVQDAARQAMSFDRSRAIANYRFTGDPEHVTAVKVVAPIVVTQAPLFTCELTQRRGCPRASRAFRRLAIPRAACGKAAGVRPLGGRARGDGRRA